MPKYPFGQTRAHFFYQKQITKMEEQGNGDKISAKFLRLRTPDPESEPPPSNAPRTLGNIPVDYEFNDLLVNIAKQLSRADIEEMKARLKGGLITTHCKVMVEGKKNKVRMTGRGIIIRNRDTRYYEQYITKI